MRAVRRNFLRARTQRRDGHRYADSAGEHTVGELGRQPHVVIEEARHTGHRCQLAYEIGKLDLQPTAGRAQAGDEVVDEVTQARHGQRRSAGHRALLEQRDEPRHVRSLMIFGQCHVDAARGDRPVHVGFAVGERQWIAQPLDADAVDRELALVAARLHVGDRDQSAGRLGSVHRPVKCAISAGAAITR